MYCVKCGTRLPDDAAFCFKCGAQTGATAPPEPADQPRWETCEINVTVVKPGWRRIEGAFIANAIGPAGPRTVARSSPFRVKDDMSELTMSRYRPYHIEVLQRLAAAGWEPIGKGKDWYNHQFRRSVSAQVDADAAAWPTEGPWQFCVIRHEQVEHRLVGERLRFVAKREGEDAGDVVMESPEFKHYGEVKKGQAIIPVQEREALDALRILVSALVEDEWEEVVYEGDDAEWFSYRFRRPDRFPAG